MNTQELKGNWEEQKGKLKQQFAALTDNDLLFVEGQKDEMKGKLQIKLGKSKDNCITLPKELNSFTTMLLPTELPVLD